MNSQELDNNHSGKRLNLPEPDPDNITVLTRNLPNKPILPWHHYDSPWSEANEENSEGSDMTDSGEGDRESEVISTETSAPNEAENLEQLDQDELDNKIETVGANGIEPTQNLSDEVSKEELANLEQSLSTLEQSLSTDDIEESKSVELELETGQEELVPLTEPLPTAELEELKSITLNSEFFEPELVEEHQSLLATQLDISSMGDCEIESLEEEFIAVSDEDSETVDDELKQLG